MRAIAPMAATQVKSSDRVGLGQPRLDPEQDRACHHQRRDQRGAARNEGERRPIGQQHRADGADERRQPVEPDGGARRGHAGGFARFHRRRLQPVDADRLLVAHLVLEPDVDIFAGLEHLLGGLREARLVAVDRRNLEKAGQEREQRKGNEQRRRARRARPRPSRARPSARAPGQPIAVRRRWCCSSSQVLPFQFRRIRAPWPDNKLKTREPCHCGKKSYCSRTMTLSVAPLASITVSRTKPGPSGVKK